MNPLGLILIGLGLVLIIIGFKGSQHNIITALQGVKGGGKLTVAYPQSGPTTNPSTGSPSGSGGGSLPPGAQIV